VRHRRRQLKQLKGVPDQRRRRRRRELKTKR
jgi:hypothetical protein